MELPRKAKSKKQLLEGIAENLKLKGDDTAGIVEAVSTSENELIIETFKPLHSLGNCLYRFLQYYLLCRVRQY